MSEQTQTVQQQQPQEQPKEHPKPQGNKVQISSNIRKNRLCMNIGKNMLNNGEKEVELSGLGNAISNVVYVVEELKKGGFVVVNKVQTSHLPSHNNRVKPKLQVFVSKAQGFEAAYEKEEVERKEREEKKRQDREEQEKQQQQPEQSNE